MNYFKSGDFVVCIDNQESNLKIGKTYEVIHTEKDLVYINYSSGYYYWRFKLYKPVTIEFID